MEHPTFQAASQAQRLRDMDQSLHEEQLKHDWQQDLID